MIIKLQSTNCFLNTLLIPLRCTRHRNNFSLFVECNQINIVVVNWIEQVAGFRLLTWISEG
ncbi:hypothetical protein RPPX_13280 [Pseudomonas putida S12]|uniref:Uncharacterized protein n=1 Tax=Pseudomonas putida S12 TaxID=1215087 RepID=A0AA34RVF0_PSEPU|nr:hypothetical protein RPPX_13280 [Pseudomonas putida S12]